MRTNDFNLCRITGRAALFALVAGILGCTQGLDMSDDELVKRVNECHSDTNKTPGMAVSCGNYFDECKRRGKETGNYIC